MKWSAILSALRTRATSDTGTGGLFLTASPMLTGWYTERPPQQAWSYPYVVMTPVSMTRENIFDSTRYSDEYTVQIALMTAFDADPDAAQTIIDRIITRFDRWEPTVSGFDCSQLIHESAQWVALEDETRQYIFTFRLHLAKVP